MKGIERKEDVQRCQEAAAKALEGQKEPRVAPGEQPRMDPVCHKHRRGPMQG